MAAGAGAAGAEQKSALLSPGLVLWILPGALKVEYHEGAEPIVAIQI